MKKGYCEGVGAGQNCLESYTCLGLARTIHIRYFWQGDRQIYGHIRCVYTVLANPIHGPYVHHCHDEGGDECTSFSALFVWEYRRGKRNMQPVDDAL